MKKLYLIFFASFLFQINSNAQFEIYNNKQQLNTSSEKMIDIFNVKIDSLMLDSIITTYINTENIPGAATLILKDNELIWNKNYGFRDLQSQLPVEDSTLFLMASISKTFVATAIMQLWENNLIDLEGNINNYLPPGFTVKNPLYSNDTITVKMLMTHSSSIQDNWNILDQLWSCGDYPVSYDSFLVNYFTPGGTYYSLQNFYNYHPGQYSNYSNAATCLLALVIEHLTGKQFADYIRDSIFIPLTMNSSSWFLEGMDTSKIAIPYINPPNPSCHTGMAYWPISQLRTNKFELLHFISAYLNGGMFNNNKILDSSTISLMMSDQLGFANNFGEVQGLIWMTFNTVLDQSNIWGHSGGWFGCSTVMILNQQEEWAVLLFINKASPPNNYSPGFLPTCNQLAKYAHLYGNIYAFNSTVNKPYAKVNLDSVLFLTKFSNIYNHPFTPHLIYANTDSTQIDSITLYDDGLHGDSITNDGIYGGFIPPQQNENFYSLSVSTTDHQTTKYFNTPDICRFTTAGPVVLDSISCIKQSTYYRVKSFLKNLSNTVTIPNAAIILKCNDPWLHSIWPKQMNLGNIAPGGTVSNSITFTVRVVDSLFQGYFNFKVEVLSDGWHYWTDSMQIVVSVEEEESWPKDFSLQQNYPNPFNPRTVIRYQLPVSSEVTLKVFDVLGNEIVTLVNEYKQAGKYEVEFNVAQESIPAISSGVYLYQLKAGEFIQTRKMILLK